MSLAGIVAAQSELERCFGAFYTKPNQSRKGFGGAGGGVAARESSSIMVLACRFWGFGST